MKAFTAILLALVGSAAAGDLLEKEKFAIPDSSRFLPITMIRIEAESFVMGSPADETGRGADEAQREVAITRAFYMSETEITQSQYLPVMVPNYRPMFIGKGGYGHSLPELHDGGPFYSGGKYDGPRENAPMEGITWERAIEFCRKLTERERTAGRLPEGYVYRLPTEAEWEYACRAGTTGPFNSKWAEVNMSSSAVSARGLPRPVKKGQPNAWGLFGMHGGVYEWCQDDYLAYDSKALIDPVVKGYEQGKVARGGCELSKAISRKAKEAHAELADRIRYTRSAARNYFPADFPLPIVGMRVVLGPELK